MLNLIRVLWSRQRTKKSREYYQTLEEIKCKDILKLSEAVIYLDTDPETLIEEIITGKIPAGKIGGEWRFYKKAIVEHLWAYQNLQSENHPPFEEYNFESISIKELLKVDPNIGNKIIKDYYHGRRVFDGMDLRGVDFSGNSLGGIDFSLSDLIGAGFRACNLLDANFSESNCREADFTGADLTLVDFKGADLTNANFTRAVLVESCLSGATISGINLKDAQILNPTF